MTSFDDLLALQDLDLRADQLRHRLASLPEQAALDAHRAGRAAFEASTADVQVARDELAREQKRLEDEVAGVEEKAAEVDRTLYAGTVTSPRELQALQDELAALRRRQRQLEDAVLEVMERAEPVDADLAERATRAAELEAEDGRLADALREAAGEAGRELEDVESRRAESAAAVEADLLARYEQLRPQHGGIAVARLVGANCGGCHLTLSAVEVDQLRKQPADALVYCSECGRLLVR